jgi:hypothetical protein
MSPSVPEPTPATSAIAPWDGRSTTVLGAIAALRGAAPDDANAIEVATEGLGAYGGVAGGSHAAWRVTCMQWLLKRALHQGRDVAPVTHTAIRYAESGPLRTWFLNPDARPILCLLPERARTAGMGRAAGILCQADTDEAARTAAQGYLEWAASIDAGGGDS